MEIKSIQTLAEVLGAKPPEVKNIQTMAEVLGAKPPEVKNIQTMAEVLLTPINFSNIQAVVEVLGQIGSAFNPIYTDQVIPYVIQADTVPPVDQVISPENVAQAWCYQITQMPIDDPISYSRVAQSVTMAVLASPIITISTETIEQFWSYVVAESILPAPDLYFSHVDVAQQAIIVLQSMDIPYTPTSGVFVPQTWSLAVIASDPMPMYRSTVYAAQNALQVVSKHPMRMHRSNVYVAQEFSQVVQPSALPMHRSPVDVAQYLSQVALPATFDEHTVGVEHAASVSNLAMVSSPVELPISYSRVPHYSTTVLHVDPTSLALPLSYSRVASLTEMRVYASPDFEAISLTSTASVTSLAVSDTTYLPPINYLVWGRASQALQLATQAATDYPPPSESQGAAQAQQVYQLVSAPPKEPYESPEDMYNRSRAQMVPQVHEYAVQRDIRPMPISYAPVKQFYEMVVRKEPLPTPGEVAESGVRIWQINQPIAARADYPDANLPYSSLTAWQLLEHVATPAEYPDVHLPTSDGIVSQAIEHVAQGDTFPNPNEMFRPLLVSQVVEQTAQTDIFPQWDTLHKPLEVRQVILHYSDVAVYPDKDIPQSKLKVSQVLEHVADVTNYPDKDTPQSVLRAKQMLEQVMTRDRSMYVMPLPPRKHRVQISCRFVY
ncbi:hypothetical protein [Providencia phage vB_PreS-Stilesk]|uniref:Uncharacterized protein n=1 Tax=Providencia phage vB_PreS-Stilesk TaxID=2761110 RepID=A0A7G5B140_9CAUD|nr:hypothetical protein JT352_gp34 [Providencia phage vB_PreS-Stilesk]QMV30013.1 hypothetical protein [Providencia phage vB_PreS-Stilesk]